MKYLFAILAIAVAFSIASVFLIWPERQPDENDVVLTVNDLQVTSSMLEISEKKRSSHHENRTDFLNAVAIEQVLIQEAQRQKIDQEPTFREAIKSHYEETLIKILLDRQNLEIDDIVSEEEIDSYLSLFGRTITFTIAQGRGILTSEIDWSNGKTTQELFDLLSTSLQPVLAGLKPGDTRAAVFDTGNEWFAVKVENIAESSGLKRKPVPRETIRTIIAAHKREQQMNNWINSLIANADILIKDENNVIENGATTSPQ